MRLQNMKRSETTEQIRVFEWCRANFDRYPDLKSIFHVPNEGKRSAAAGSIAKAAGLHAGIPDIHLPIARGRYIGLWVEMKYGRNTLTRDQKEYMILASRQGHYCAVCYSAMAAVQVIEQYINLTGSAEMNMGILEENGIENSKIIYMAGREIPILRTREPF